MTDITEVLILRGNVQELASELSKIFQPIFDEVEEFMAKSEEVREVGNIDQVVALGQVPFYMFIKGLVELDRQTVTPFELLRVVQVVKQDDGIKIYVKFNVEEAVRNDFIKFNDHQILRGFDPCIEE